MNYKRRIKNLKKALKGSGLNSALIVNKENIRYLCGFSGSISILLVADKNYLFVDPRYTYRAETEAKEVKLIETKKHLSHLDCAIQKIKHNKIPSLGFEEHHFNAKGYLRLKEELLSTNIVPIGNVVEELRSVKDTKEINSIMIAIKIAEKAFEETRSIILPGISENKIASELIYWIRELGGKDSFEPIVTSSHRAAAPHAVASENIINEGDLVIVDFGAQYNGYCSDLTRSFVVGAASKKQNKFYNAVLDAQLTAIKMIRPGVLASDVEKAARKSLKNKQLEHHFKHALGHGIGLFIHEEPKLSIKSDQKLKAGMVFTVEPGIYIKGWGGIRIEDMVLVTKTGCKVLTSLPKEINL